MTNDKEKERTEFQKELKEEIRERAIEYAEENERLKAIIQAQDEILKCVPIGEPFNNTYLAGFNEALEKFTLLKDAPTVATDNTLPVEDGTNVIKILGDINEAITKNKKNKPLTPEQIEGVIEWMNEWDQLRYGPIPIRFKEDFSAPH